MNYSLLVKGPRQVQPGLRAAAGLPQVDQSLINLGYQEPLHSGKWPDQTICGVGELGSESKGSINKHGHYQTEDLMGIEVRGGGLSPFSRERACFGFDQNVGSAKANAKVQLLPVPRDRAAREHWFMQFCPTVKPGEKVRGLESSQGKGKRGAQLAVLYWELRKKSRNFVTSWQLRRR